MILSAIGARSLGLWWLATPMIERRPRISEFKTRSPLTCCLDPQHFRASQESQSDFKHVLLRNREKVSHLTIYFISDLKVCCSIFLQIEFACLWTSCMQNYLENVQNIIVCRQVFDLLVHLTKEENCSNQWFSTNFSFIFFI